jgi:hypothetical protein
MVDHHDPDDYFEAIRCRYEACLEESRRKEDGGQGENWPVIYYYTPTRERFRVLHLSWNSGSDVMELEAADQRNNSWVIFASTMSTQLVLTLIEAPKGIERKPVGFGSRE